MYVLMSGLCNVYYAINGAVLRRALEEENMKGGLSREDALFRSKWIG